MPLSPPQQLLDQINERLRENSNAISGISLHLATAPRSRRDHLRWPPESGRLLSQDTPPPIDRWMNDPQTQEFLARAATIQAIFGRVVFRVEEEQTEQGPRCQVVAEPPQEGPPLADAVRNHVQEMFERIPREREQRQVQGPTPMQNRRSETHPVRAILRNREGWQKTVFVAEATQIVYFADAPPIRREFRLVKSAVVTDHRTRRETREAWYEEV